MRHPNQLLGPAAIGLALALGGTACGEGGPPLQNPNGTLQVVLDNLGGYSLHGMQLSQDIRISFAPDSPEPQSSVLRFWNFTPSQVDPTTLLGIADSNYYVIAENPSIWTYDIPTGDPRSPQVSIQVRTSHRFAEEHDILTIPKNAPAPPDFDKTLEGETSLLEEQTSGVSQTISLVRKGTALTVEDCQAEVEVDPLNPDGYPDIDPTLFKRLAQEQFCNSLGSTENAILAGYSYDQYLAYQQHVVGFLVIGGVKYSFKAFLISSALYYRLQDRLLGGNG